MRSLSPEEADLWVKVTATIRPLSPSPPESGFQPTEPLEPREAQAAAKIVPAQRSVRHNRDAVRPREQLQGSTLDGTWDKRLRSGSVQPDRTVDLHGMNLNHAWWAIDRSLDESIARGERLILLITGHHRGGEPPVQRGRIRAAVHDWLAASRHASDIAAVRAAHPRHGGGGSLYLVLRRSRRPR